MKERDFQKELKEIAKLGAIYLGIVVLGMVLATVVVYVAVPA